MIRFLSSMKFAFWSMITLIIWSFIGVGMSSSGAYKDGFKMMNDQLIINWFFNEGLQNPFVTMWFVGFCIIGALLSLSFFFCTFTNLYKLISKKSNKIRNVLLFGIHLLFICIVGFHVLSMLIGYKKGNVNIFEGQSVTLDDKYIVTLNAINFLDNPEILQQKDKHSKIKYTEENFHIKDNYADFTIRKNTKTIANGKAYMLSPLISKSYRLTIEQFILEDSSPLSRIGVKFVFMKNPILYPFFISYALVILMIIIFTIITWKNHSLNKTTI
jgi:hypothetical protein